MPFVNNCPVCEKEPNITCRCMRAEMCCKNDHYWSHCLAHENEVKAILMSPPNWSKSHQIAIDICICHLELKESNGS